MNTSVNSTEEYLNMLKREGISASVSPYSPYSIRIEGSIDPRRLPGFSDGAFFVQDASSAASVYLLGAKRGDVVADACACPGGKSFAAAVMMENEGEIHSFDLHESKLSLIDDGAKRLKLDIIKTAVRDARCPDEALFGRCDRVICDVPCSGLGVLSKKPDLRYKSEEGISDLPALQYEILSASAKYLKVGGRLAYSTCTVLPEENEQVLSRFLSENDSFMAVDFKIGDSESVCGAYTFMPTVTKTDGFFVGIIERIK